LTNDTKTKDSKIGKMVSQTHLNVKTNKP